MLRRRIFPLLIALFCVTVLVTRVDRDFPRERQGIPGPHQVLEGRLTVQLPDLSALAGHPAAIVARVRGGSVPADLVMRFDGREIARASVAARAAVRIDGAVVPERGRQHRLDIEGSVPDWRVRDLEVANIHGFSRGAISLVIVPAARTRAAPLPPWVVLPLAAVLILFPPRFGWPGRPRARVAHFALTIIAVLALMVVLAVSWLTPFNLFLAPHTMLLLVGVVYAERLADAWDGLTPRARPALLRGMQVIRYGAVHLVITAFVLSCLASFYLPGYGLTPLIMFGTEFYDTASADVRRAQPFVWQGAGYDGQFYAHLATDPLLEDPETIAALDTPGYRAPRVLFPAVAHVLGLGHTPFVLQSYATFNIVCWLALGWLMLRWCPPGDHRDAAAWTACLLSHGLITSVTRSLVDGPSMLMLVLAIAALERGVRARAGVIMGLALLGRDTNLLAAPLLLERGTRAATLALYVVALVVPIALWLLYLDYIGLSLGRSGETNFDWPLAGYIAEWGAAIRSVDPDGVRTFVGSNLLAIVALTTQAVALMVFAMPSNAWWRMGAAYTVLLVVLGTPVWEGQPSATTRILLPMTFAFNVLLPRRCPSRWFWPVWALGNVNIADSLLLLMPWLAGSHLH